MTWIVKRHRYDGTTSVVAIHDSKAEADADASKRNRDEQSDRYKVEKWKEKS